MATHTAIAATAQSVLSEITLPTPKPGAGEVVIRMQYAALVPFDTYQLDKAYYATWPTVLGFAGAGEVTEISEGVEGLTVGDKVTTMNFPLSVNKSMQEYALVPRGLVAKLPPGYSLANAASIPDNYLTAYWTLFHSANLALPAPTQFPVATPPPQANEPVLVYGGGASSAQYTVQLLAIAGYTRVIVAASTPHHTTLHALGAWKCVDYRTGEAAFVDAVLAATDGAKVKLAIDVIGARPTLSALGKVVGGEGAKVAVLIPVKEGNNVTDDVGSAMYFELPKWVGEVLPGVETVPVYTFRSQEDTFTRENVMPKILPQLLEKGLLQPNRIRLLKEGSFKDRVATGLELLRTNKISGEKVVVEISAE